MSVVNIKLTDLINKIGEGETYNLLADFSCSKEKDVEYFIKKKAIPFELMHKARTSLLCYIGEDKSEFEIIAYYSLAIKPFNLDGISQTKQKSIRGGALPRGKKDNNISAILIGQLGRNDNSKVYLSSNALFAELFKSIHQVNVHIGTRIVYLECHDNQKLREIYTEKGFQVLKDKAGVPIINKSGNDEYLVFIMTTNQLRYILDENKLLI